MPLTGSLGGFLVQVVRARGSIDGAEEKTYAPGVGPLGQLADVCWFSSGVRGLVPERRLEGLHLAATDQDWSWGVGRQASGPSEALAAMAGSGRSVALDDLTGPGIGAFRDRVRPSMTP